MTVWHMAADLTPLMTSSAGCATTSCTYAKAFWHPPRNSVWVTSDTGDTLHFHWVMAIREYIPLRDYLLAFSGEDTGEAQP